MITTFNLLYFIINFIFIKSEPQGELSYQTLKNDIQKESIGCYGPTYNEWTGTQIAQWSQGQYWSLNVAPLFCHDVNIPATGDVIVGEDFPANALTLEVEFGASLTIYKGSSLTCLGEILD